jgi:plastocyanin
MHSSKNHMIWLRALCALAAIATAATLSTGCGDSGTSQAGVSPQPGTTATATPAASPSGTPGATVQISIPANATGKGPAAYGANPATVEVGATVTWTNNDSIAHTVTADDNSFDSGPMQPGQTFSHTFSQAGTVPYHCSIHGAASMSGTIQVTSASPSPSATPSSSPSAGSAGGTPGTGGGTTSY